MLNSDGRQKKGQKYREGGYKKYGPLIVIVGETASGKSALALELAKRFDGEIIAADSWTVRRGVNIGTAKPTPLERAEIKHHLLDVIEPCGDFTAAVFKKLANATIHDITSRGKLPIMVGGTGLYIDGVLYDYGFLPAGDREKRRQLNELSIPQLLEKLIKAGVDTDGLDTRNKRRLIRALETAGAQPSRGDMRPNTLVIGLQVPRSVLRANVERRVDAMLAAGLQVEVERLVANYGWDCEALKGIGYREWRGFFEDTYDLQATRAAIIKSTLDLAKRQRTWFRRNKSIQWVDNTARALELTTRFLNITH